MNKVWISRSQPGADKTAKIILAMGHTPITAPLLKIKPPHKSPPELPHSAVIIVTSKNGLAALAASTPARHWPLVTVGAATATAAHEYGFEVVHAADGTSKDVTQLVKTVFTNDQRPVIHVSGQTVRGTIIEDLRAAGYAAERHIYYISKPVPQRPDLKLKGMTHILLYSPMAAKALVAFELNLAHVTAISISCDVDNELGDIPLKARRIAAKPTEQSMLTILD